MKTIFIIDVQNGFINKETSHIPDIINNIAVNYEHVIVKKFINNNPLFDYIGWDEMKCGTELDLSINVNESLLLELTTYSGVCEQLKKYIFKHNITELDLCGISTRSCVLATAFDLFDIGIKVNILQEACASTSGVDDHNAGLKILKDNIDPHIVLTTTK